MLNAKITGIASYVPDDILTNDDLSRMVDTNDEWITTRVGIKQRHILKRRRRRFVLHGHQSRAAAAGKHRHGP